MVVVPAAYFRYGRRAEVAPRLWRNRTLRCCSAA
jgi:hypothetical protein